MLKSTIQTFQLSSFCFAISLYRFLVAWNGRRSKSNAINAVGLCKYLKNAERFDGISPQGTSIASRTRSSIRRKLFRWIFLLCSGVAKFKRPKWWVNSGTVAERQMPNTIIGPHRWCSIAARISSATGDARRKEHGEHNFMFAMVRHVDFWFDNTYIFAASRPSTKLKVQLHARTMLSGCVCLCVCDREKCKDLALSI